MVLANRRGVAAVIAAVLIFAPLVVSDLVALTSANQQEGLSAEGNAESLLYAEGLVGAASTGLSLLASEQAAVAGTMFACQGAASQHLPTLAVEYDAPAGLLAVRSSVAPLDGAAGAQEDNLSVLAPYAGVKEGSIGFAFNFSISAGPYDGVSYHRSELHYVGLPGNLSLVQSFCRRASSLLLSAAAGQGPCNASGVQREASLAVAAISADARTEGLVVDATTATNPVSCLMSVAVVVTQSGLMGPGGQFSLSAEETETVPAQG